MSATLIPIKAFLGKYYPELSYSAVQEKYKETSLDTFFEQRFVIQNNKAQMIVDPNMKGLTVVFFGNEIFISKEFYDHPNIIVTNSLESNPNTNPRSLYNSEVFSTVAYLICQNHTTFEVVGEIDQPIYVKYKSDYETFYNSVVSFEITNDISVEIVEEIESACALNTVTNYRTFPGAKLNLSTFYVNHISGISYTYRNIITEENSTFNHILFGKGSSNIIDENKLTAYNKSNSEFLGMINSNDKNFHSILYVQPMSTDYTIRVDYKDVLYGKANISFFPVILGQSIPENASISVSNITLEDIPKENVALEIKNYLSDIAGRATLERMVGVERYYDNKSKFLLFP
jgi:hypothetical protein